MNLQENEANLDIAILQPILFVVLLPTSTAFAIIFNSLQSQCPKCGRRMILASIETFIDPHLLLVFIL
jgi:hypothetical protein